MKQAFARRYVLSFGDQGLTALLSLCVSLWLIRRGAEGEFGAYVFWASTALVATSLAAALTSVHLHGLRPAPLAGRRGMERTLLLATMLLAAGSAALVVLALPLLGHSLRLWGAMLLLPGTLLGVYARALAVSRGVLAPALGVSLAVFLAVTLGLAAGEWLDHSPTANGVLVLTGLAQGLAGGIVLARLSTWPLVGLGRGSLARWRVLLGRSLWPLAGGVAAETSARLYVFLVAAMAGTLAMSALAAGQTLLRPATLLAGAWAGAARSALAQRRHAGDRAGFQRLVATGAAGPALATLALGGMLALFWVDVADLAFGGRYADLAPVVLLWTLNMAIACFVFAFGVGLQALGQLGAAARADLSSALVIAFSMPVLLWVLPPPGALVAMILGGLAQLGLQWRVLRRPWATPLAPVRLPITQ